MNRLKTVFLSGLLILFPMIGLYAFERVIILNSAVSQIAEKLELNGKIVGITLKDNTFSGATKVGSHLRPNIELMKALKPDLVIAGSSKAFSEEMRVRLNTEVFRYDPQSLEDILRLILKLGTLFQKEDNAENLVRQLKSRLNTMTDAKTRVTVIFEVSERALKLAGKKNIITSMIETAGGTNLINVNKKHVLISPEKILVLNPDIYIYQNGPMNKNPTDPLKRNYFQSLKSKVIEVDQLEFTRPGLNTFDAVLKLNIIFKEFLKS
ncbi:ABC transporter substrate-binding protein [bacterium]|nr:ABC transporter substrate-binding protein [bacterium]